MSDDEDGYEGAAELIADGRVIDVRVSLRGHFEPISGSFAWYGRVAASDAVSALIAGGARKVILRTPHAEVSTSLTDVDPWGRPRVAGSGPTPFPVMTELPTGTD